MTTRIRFQVLAACLAVWLGCGDSASRDASADRVRLGDTIVVRSGTPAWGDSTLLVEEITIGALEGPPEYQFGDFIDFTVDEAGGVYVFDGQDPALRYYDASGTYRRTLGGEGEGPGEYRDVSLGLAVRHGDGRLIMRDPRNGRLNLYTPEGSPSESWPVSSGLYTGDAMFLDSSDHVYLKVLTDRPEPNKAWPIGLLHLDDHGEIVDTIAPPKLRGEPIDYEGVFGVEKVWSHSPLGGFVVGVNNRYRIEHYRRDGTVLRIERDIDPVPILPEERQEREAVNAWRRRNDDDDPPPVPRTKPFYRSINVGDDGRIWVQRYVRAHKGEPIQRSVPQGSEPPPSLSWHEQTVYDVFEADGTYLGSITAPDRTTLEVFRGDATWGIRRGSFGEPQVVRFRISFED